MSTSALWRLAVVTFLLFAVAACDGSGGGEGGEGGGESPNAVAGRLVDNPVSGVAYDSENGAGLTDRQGRYRAAGEVVFWIGDIELGRAFAAGYLTPAAFFDLSGGQDPLQVPGVVNVIRLLQTLDADGDVRNGIAVDAVVRDAGLGRSLDFDQPVADFETDPAVIGFLCEALRRRPDAPDCVPAPATAPLVPADTARGHFAETLDHIDRNGEPNVLPDADAGVDREVTAGETVTLAGFGDDSDGEVAVYEWAQGEAGPRVGLDDVDSAEVSFVAPQVDATVRLDFRLSVTDDDGAIATDEAIVTVFPAGGDNTAPTADGLSLVTDEDTPVSAQLDGEDADGDALAYTIVDQAGGGSVELADDGLFTYTPEAGFNGEDSFTYRAGDGRAESNLATVDILVREGGGPSNERPVADAGADGTLDEGTPVTLDGSDSFDPDGEIAGYEWAQIAGTPVTLDDPQAPAPSFTAPQVDIPLATLVFRLTVTDDAGTTGIATVRVFVRDVPVGRIRVGAAKRTVTPDQRHIDGVEEQRLLLTPKLQKFNLGGFGIDPLQNLPDPLAGLGDLLTEPAGERVYEGEQGPEHTWVRVMMLQRRNEDDSVTRLAFVTLDAIGAGNVIQDGVRRVVSEATGVPEANVLFGQTHTHAGADLQGLWGGVPQDWIQTVLYRAAAEAAQEAMQRLRPARLSVRTRELPAFNNYRRPRVFEDARADETATLLRAEDTETGELLASLLQYNAHPTNIGGDEYEKVEGLDGRAPHADYVLGTVEALEAEGGVALYYNGPIADASSSGPGGENDYVKARNRGEALAAAMAPDPAAARTLADKIEVRHEQVVLPVTNPLFLVAGVLGSFNRYYDFLELPISEIPALGELLNQQFQNLPQVTLATTTQVSRITLGEGEDALEIVTIPGEATNTFGQYVQALAGDRQVMFLGLTQNTFGYILPEEEFSYINATGEVGFLLPFTNYEEFVSLGPLTAPMLRIQGYNPLFDAPPEANLPPPLTACFGADNGERCIVEDIAARPGWYQRAYGERCRDTFGEDSGFCRLIDPGPQGDALADLCRALDGSEAVCEALDFSDGLSGGGGDGLGGAAFDARLRGCDLLDTSHCLFPFPSNHFTRPDPATPTGKRVDLSLAAMPRNLVGKPINPIEWNRNDGFSPGQLIATYVPELDLTATGAVPLTDLIQSFDADAPIQVLDAETGVPQLIWAEKDANAGFFVPSQGIESPGEARSALLIRPAKNFREGRRYVVVLRELKNADGERIEAGPAFAACRDQLETEHEALQARCARLESDVFPLLAQEGIARDESLYLAWDFTVVSTENITERLVHMRDDAFAALGESGQPGEPGYQMGQAPEFSVTSVTDNPDDDLSRRIEGTITVPSYVAPSDPSPLEIPGVVRILEALEARFPEQAEILFEGLDIVSQLSLPPNRLFYNPVDGEDGGGLRFGDGLPDRSPIGDMNTRFVCNVPKSAVADFAGASADDVTPARASLYGHGLLGSRTEVGAGNVEDMGNEHNMMFCAVDWFGFATGDVLNVLTALIDLSLFPVIPDASQQGMLNQLFLARLLHHPQGFASHEAFRVGGRPVFDNREVFYDGNSQGGILGGPVAALSKDIDRAVLGVPGMNYSTLLRRSVDFDLYSLPLYLSYRDDLDRTLGFALMQMLWDRSENNGYAAHITEAPLPGSRPARILMHPAFGDHQVTMWSADVMARTAGLVVDDSRVDPERHPDVDPYYPLLRIDYGEQGRADTSAMVVWDAGPEVTPPPPVTNTPPREGDDPHGYPRNQIAARCQKSHFLHPQGAVLDVAGITQMTDCPATPEIPPPPFEPPPEGDMPAALGGCLPDPTASGCVLRSIGALLQVDEVIGLGHAIQACGADEDTPECVATALGEVVDLAQCRPKLTAPGCPVGNLVGDLLGVIDDLSPAVMSDALEPGPAAGESRAGRSYARYLRSDSDEIIAFQVFEPSTLTGGQRYPLVLHGHGFGGSRMTEPSGLVARLLDAGYGVISIDQRGFGESSGTVRVMDPDFEGRDLVQILDWAESNLGWLAYEDDNLVLGAIGGSYGGGYQLLLESVDPEARLDALAPDITWNDLRYSLNPGNTIKSGWALLLVAGGEAGSQLLQMDPFIKETLVRAILTNDFPEDSLDWFNHHSLDYVCRPPGASAQGVYGATPDYPGSTLVRGSLPEVDVLLTQGMRDTLFNFNEAARNYQCLRALTGGDVRLLTHESGHILPLAAETLPPLDEIERRLLNGLGLDLPAFQGPGGPRDCGALNLDDATMAWLDEKLKGIEGAADLLGGDDQICYSLATDDAVFSDSIPRGGTDLTVPLIENVTVGAAAAAGLAFNPRVAEIGTVGPGGGVLAGIPTADLVIRHPGGIGQADAIVYVGLGVRRVGEQTWSLIDDQIIPVRGLGQRQVDLVGVGERLQPGDRIGLMVSGFHLQYLESFSRDLRVLSVDLDGEVSLPLIDGTIVPAAGPGAPPSEPPVNGGGLLGLLSDTIGDVGVLLGSVGQLLGLVEDPASLPPRLRDLLVDAPMALVDALSGLAENLVALVGLNDNGPVTALVFDLYANVGGLLSDVLREPGDVPADLAATVREVVDDAGNLVGLNEAVAAREVEPVVLLGARFPTWSALPAFGIPNNPTPLAEPVRDAHDGRMVAPSSLGENVLVDEIAAYRWQDGGWIEIPVQVDERFPYFLSNDNSDFGVYSGTDPELTYAWDDENWKKTSTRVVTLADGRTRYETAYPPGEGPVPDPVAGLDHDDEIVFMASDAGEARAPVSAAPPAGAGEGRQVVLVDPLDPDTLRYAYLFRQPDGSSFTRGNGYVEYQRHENADEWIDRNFFRDDDPEKIGSSNRGYGANLAGPVRPPENGYFNYTRAGCAPGSAECLSDDRFPRDGLTVTTARYRWEASGRWMVRDIRLAPPGESGAVDWASRLDLIDRWKGRAFQQTPDSDISLVGFEDEQVNWEANASLIGELCGPVRCIRETWGADSGTNVTKTETFYRDAVAYRFRVRVHPIPPDGLYTNWDYNRDAMIPMDGEAVEAGRYYNALRPDGVPIDGVPDDVLQIDELPVPGCSGVLELVDSLLSIEFPNFDEGSLAGCATFFDLPDPTFNLPLGFTTWEQISGKGDAGSLVYIFEIKGLTTLTNPVVVPYYRDDACFDDGTGDDPVPRPWPGEESSDPRVVDGYSALAGRPVDTGSDAPFEDCIQRQGAHGSHGIHILVLVESDSLFTGIPLTELDGQQWQFMVPTARPQNVGQPYANTVRVPLQAVVLPIQANEP